MCCQQLPHEMPSSHRIASETRAARPRRAQVLALDPKGGSAHELRQSGFGRALEGASGGVSSSAAFAASRPSSSVSKRRSHAVVDALVL